MKTKFVFLGGTGHLFFEKLLPALYSLDKNKRLSNFDIVAIGRRFNNNSDYKKHLREKMQEHLGISFSEKSVNPFINKFSYLKSDYSNYESFENFCEFSPAENYIFYLSTLPKYYPTVINLINDFFVKKCRIKKKKIVIEKPFGLDEKTSDQLEKLLSDKFDENEIFHVDHYLGKEAMQNIIVLRSDNYLFEKLLSKEHVQEVRISISERAGVKERANFYDKTGAIKDVIQNHLLQVLAMIGIDLPNRKKFDDVFFKQVSKRKNLLLKNLKLPSPNEIFLGQYSSYESDVGHNSSTETFVSFSTFLDTDRWRGVPFRITTGKKLEEKRFFMEIIFKPFNNKLNKLIFEFQPNEELKLQVNTKKLRGDYSSFPVELKFNYLRDFGITSPEAYENILYDIVYDKKRSFANPEFIKNSWKYIDALLDLIQKHDVPLRKYDDYSICPCRRWIFAGDDKKLTQ